MSRELDLLVIGAGVAGLTAAWQTAVAGQKTRVIAKGWGTTHWHTGCVDVLGYYPLDSETAVASPREGIGRLIADNPQHPYALAGLETLEAALSAFQALCAAAGYPLHGSLDNNFMLPTAVGALRPTCLIPETMLAGDTANKDPMLLVGFKRLPDFFANVVAENLTAQGIPAADLTLTPRLLEKERVMNSVLMARHFERPEFRAEIVKEVKKHLGKAKRVGFPAVLGHSPEAALAVKQDLERQIGCPVFEIPTAPPSVPGIRLHTIFMAAIRQAGGRVYDGMEALRAESEGGRVTAVYTESAARERPHRAQNYLLATGGILGGGITTDHLGETREVVFNLPLNAPQGREEWFKRRFLDAEGHPIYQSGVEVNGRFQPINGAPDPIYQNLFAAGGTLAHCEPIRERSLEGVALATGFKAAEVISGQ
jgi:glycerol-3-phosphate dehydrogenase subunit B